MEMERKKKESRKVVKMVVSQKHEYIGSRISDARDR